MASDSISGISHSAFQAVRSRVPQSSPRHRRLTASGAFVMGSLTFLCFLFFAAMPDGQHMSPDMTNLIAGLAIFPVLIFPAESPVGNIEMWPLAAALVSVAMIGRDAGFPRSQWPWALIKNALSDGSRRFASRRPIHAIVDFSTLPCLAATADAPVLGAFTGSNATIADTAIQISTEARAYLTETCVMAKLFAVGKGRFPYIIEEKRMSPSYLSLEHHQKSDAAIEPATSSPVRQSTRLYPLRSSYPNRMECLNGKT